MQEKGWGGGEFSVFDFLHFILEKMVLDLNYVKQKGNNIKRD